ncbi:GspH/FimT family pseudopilin [Ramlibacter sp. MAHUQ-53]|uniref:GspH/FimT family pseudopilin n=1 Tax=unclassified Ramlibacter TaxID=2617605 RepID=UPI003635D80B
MSTTATARAPRAGALRSTRGVTLVESLVAIAILAVLGALAAPSFRTQLAAARLSSATSELTGSLMQARALAVRLGRRVTVCRSQDQSTCDTDAKRHWGSGWITFIDADGNGSRSGTETLTYQVSPLDADLRVRGNGTLTDRVTFVPSGGARANGTLRVCSADPGLGNDARARQLVMQQTGRVVVERVAGIQGTCPGP